MKPVNIPIKAVDPDSQPLEAEGERLDYMQMPKDMHIYHAPQLPETDAIAELKEGMAVLERLQHFLGNYNGKLMSIDANRLDAANRKLVDQALGEGEVSIICTSPWHLCIQESTLTGVWRVQQLGDNGEVLQDNIEVGSYPSLLSSLDMEGKAEDIRLAPNEGSEGVMNAPTLLAEISDRAGSYQSGDAPHIINLTLLPQTPEDLSLLEKQLGLGPVMILSRGYGNCRILSTNFPNVWWVRYFNSPDDMILNSIEIVDVPVAACAAAEDIADSAERLHEIMEVFA